MVTNHSLLAVDMLAGRHIVPPHKLLIVDEAHELADRVSSAAQAELSPELIDRAARRARPLLRPEAAEALAAAADALVGRAGRGAGRADHRGLPAAAAGGVHAAATPPPGRGSDDRRRSRPTIPTRSANSRPRPSSTSCPAPPSGCSRRPSTTWPGWNATSGSARGRWWSPRCRWPVPSPRTCTTSAPWSPPRRPWPWAAGSTPWRRAWASPPPTAEPPPPPRTALRAAGRRGSTVPAHWPRGPRSPPGRRSAGGRDPGPGWRSLDVGSPFDYARQGILYVAAHLPRPSASGLPDAAGEELRRAGQRARWPYPRAVLLPAGRRSRPRSWSGRAPT